MLAVVTDALGGRGGASHSWTHALCLGVAGARDALADGQLGTAVAEDELADAIDRTLAVSRPDPDGLAREVRALFDRERFAQAARIAFNRLMEII